MKKYFSLIAIASLILLSACGTSPETKFYNLSSNTTAAKSIDTRKLSIGIDNVVIAGYVERPQIVTLKDNAEINMSEYNRWAEPLTYSMQRIVSENVSTYFKNGLAKPLTTNRASYDYIVQIEINKFDGKFGSQAQLDAWWTILGKDNKILAREHSSLTSKLGNDYNDLVEKQNNLLSQLSTEIAKKISKLR